MTDRWAAVRRRAAEARRVATVLAEPRAHGRVLVEAALEARGYFVMACPPDDPVLRGCLATVEAYGVAYSDRLGEAQAAFATAHELGHVVLGHGEVWHCAEAEIDEAPDAERLPTGDGAVAAYNPRQQRELEANVFAVAFLLPPDGLRAGFLAGEPYQRLAGRFGVSPAACLNALATSLLGPPPSVADEPASPGTPTAPAAPAAPAPGVDLAPLDPSQRAAAEVPAGPVLVNAGPGTGKTRTLVGRVLHLLERGVPARQILAVTFSNRATDEMRERLLRAAPERAHELTVSTFHAFCLELLRRHHAAAGLPADVRVIDQVDGVLLLERHLDRLGLEHYLNPVYPELPLKALVGAISRAKDELVTPERYAGLAEDARRAAEEAGEAGDGDGLKAAAKWAEVARVYAAYERLLDERGLLDFGGLLLRAVRLLRERPEVLAAVRAEYRHLLVDEYQDMNRASARLLQLLAGDGKGLWVVGDLRQAIYRFRGASPANVAGFAQDFPGGRTLDLTVNYRADPRLVGLCRTAGTEMAVAGAPPCDWRAYRAGAPPPQIWLAEAEDGDAEAAGIAAEVLRRRAAGRPFREQAILARTHGQAEVIAAGLERAGVPVLYLGDLFARDEVRDLLALLALAHGDGGALLRAGAMPEHWLSRAERIAFLRFAREHQTDFPAALQRGAEAGLDAPAAAALAALHGVLLDVRRRADPWQALARYLFGHGALVRRLLAESGGGAGAAGQQTGAPGSSAARGPGGAGAAQRLAALGQLLAVARAFGQRPLEERSEVPGESIQAFLAHVRRLVVLEAVTARTPAGGEDAEAVRLLTIHAAKGLEFPVVYVPNLARNRFPARGAPEQAPPPPGLIEDAAGGELLEETCLFFVAISRAKEELVLSRAERYGKTRYPPSPFLDLVAPFFHTEEPARLTWTSPPGDAGATAPSDSAGAARRRLGMWEVERYLQCPRRYEYERVLGLAEPAEQLGYKRYHDCVARVLRELRAAGPGAGAPDPAAAEALLAATWDVEGSVGHPLEEVYRKMATRLVGAYCARRAATTEQRGAPWRDALDIPVGGVLVRVPIDDSEVLPDGTVRLIRARTGRESEEHRREPRLALLRAGATQALGEGVPVQIEVDYVATGGVRVVPPSARYEPPRIDAVAGAVRGILDGRFPATPSQARDCATCPFWVVCPA